MDTDIRSGAGIRSELSSCRNAQASEVRTLINRTSKHSTMRTELHHLAVYLALLSSAAALARPQPAPTASCGPHAIGRRHVAMTSAAALLWPGPAALAARDPAFDRMASQAPPTKDGEAPFEALPDGVKYKLMKAGPGTGDAVDSGRTVTVDMNAAALNLNGKRFFSTSLPDGTPDPLTWRIGDGRAVPGLEEGMMGMRKGDVRRIIVPADRGYNAKPGSPDGAYLPQPRNFLDQQALDSITKNPNRDASVLFDVRINRIR
mmetsp:Transcript_15500/g.41558  ORF Transcript_15500/g.41558 Transcript_15500/m.41558 type:complete len:261 (-) Transcript_15500:66-848(-)